MTKISKNLKNYAEIHLRPNADDGLWLGFLLPMAIVTSYLRHPIESTDLYCLCTVFSIGLALTTGFIVVQCKKNTIHTASSINFSPGLLMTLICYAVNKGFLLSCLIGYLSSFFFYKVYLYVLRNFPRCFTFGEALIATQAFQLYAFSTIYSIFRATTQVPSTSLQIATLIIQVGLASIGLMCYMPHSFPIFRRTLPFYIVSSIILLFMLLLPLHMLLKRSPLLWIVYMLSSDVVLFSYWVVCSVIGVYAISRQISNAKKASTVLRKTFHVLAIGVYLPGLICDCCLLYLSSGVIFGVFVLLELMRVLNLPPLGVFLQDGFSVFSDGKDSELALTPLYLLVGCSSPIWIHPAPCDLTDSSGLNLSPLLSGLLTVGIGDSFASYLGSRFGKHRWSGTVKTVEGTLGCILSQLFTVYLLMYFGFIDQKQNQMVKFVVAIVITSLVEARTNQVDNIVLPLIMYTILV